MKKMILLMAALGGLALASAANANSLTLVNDATPITGAFDWNYHVDYANSMLVAGDFVTITNLSGVTSANTVLFDGGSFVGTFTATSVTWTWSGPTVDLGSTMGTIAGFSYHSIYGVGFYVPYNSADHVSGSGLPSFVSGFVFGASIPDGGSAVALLGIALTGIEVVRRKIKNKAKAA